jgi:hypothetical protein
MRVLSLGLDVGGANTKAILLEGDRLRKHWLEYIPLWKDKGMLKHFLKNLANATRPDVVGVTTTAELCDIFGSKKEGVIEIVKTVCETFGDEICLFLSMNGTMLERGSALASVEELAAANWVAGALLVGRECPGCVMVDVGSTTTDIVALKNGVPTSHARTDFQRLRGSELVYTGVLRTPLPAILNRVRVNGEVIGISSENFAITGDVYRVLGMLSEEDYNCETPDGRGKDVESCMRRIARAFCSDLEEVGKDFIVKAAEIFHREQVTIVAKGLKRAAGRGSKVVGCGLGRRVLAEEAARRLGVEFVDFAELRGEEAALSTPAYGVAVLAREAWHGECRA